MAQATRESPYTAPAQGDDGVDPGLLAGMPAFAVPGPMETAQDPRFGWDNSGQATTLHESSTSTPDAARLRDAPLFETRPGEGEPKAWWRRFTGDLLGRHSVEFQDADGAEVAPKRAPLFYMRPRPSDIGDTRPTMKMNPSSYTFTRPFPGMGTAGRFTGVHFSMADHRRDYSILGMEPPRKTRRNTYRIEPEPWDTDLVDMPVTVDSSPDVTVVAEYAAPSGNRSWRLS